MVEDPLVLAEDEISYSQRVGSSFSCYFEVFAASHGEEESDLHELVERYGGFVEAWSVDHFFQEIEWDRFLRAN